MLATYILLGFLGLVVRSQSYDYMKGGKDWPGLCKNGTFQSPIDIEYSRSIIAPFGSGSIVSNFSKVQVSGTWNRVGLNFTGNFGTLNFTTPFDNFVGNISTIFFYAPSQHTIRGNHFDLEITLVVNGPHAGYLNYSTSFLLNAKGTNNTFVEQVLNVTRGVNNQVVSLTNLTDKNTINEYYSYEGSYTNPPCNQTVLWHIVPHVYSLSKDQLNVFQEKWAHNKTFPGGHGNNRFTQSYHGRSLTLYSSL